jgi:hypothetical protein
MNSVTCTGTTSAHTVWKGSAQLSSLVYDPCRCLSSGLAHICDRTCDQRLYYDVGRGGLSAASSRRARATEAHSLPNEHLTQSRRT